MGPGPEVEPLGTLRAFARSGRPVWGTCAGMILLAKEVVDGVLRPAHPGFDGHHRPAQRLWPSGG